MLAAADLLFCASVCVEQLPLNLPVLVYTGTPLVTELRYLGNAQNGQPGGLSCWLMCESRC